ncbi:MAG: hypothetical protein LBC83_08695 [Oscillospiraceae bacterium]|jgi:hypothetical protein|nr:hypothetical protein [Oscillospiraceae bacterium]
MTAKTSTKKKLIVLSSAFMFVLLTALALYLFGPFLGILKHKSPLKLAPQFSDYVVDPDDANALAGLVDYVFTGRVEKQHKVQYDNIFTRETEDGEKTIGSPYTIYDVTILGSMKGNLKTDNTIQVRKDSGATMDGQFLVLDEGDYLPEEGDICVFFVSAQKDGSLLIAGKNCNTKITESSLTEKKAKNKSAAQIQKLAQDEEKTIKDSSIYQKLVEACKNEIPFERTRHAAPAELLTP